ncbi:MAG: hypothetical protein RR290_01985 [Clostridia bacterium]
MAIVINKYLKKLEEKCNLPTKLIDIILSLFDKLIEFGYITKFDINKLSKKLYDNIDIIIISGDSRLDYKSGYYDAQKKELYLKNLSNIQAVYLRLMYILTTKEISETTYTVGYSTSEISKVNYKIVHKNFGLNRAIISNLVCRLLYTLPTTLSILPSYRTYENDFLGCKVVSDNDIYFLEGKLVRQLCFVMNINEELLYNNLFNNNPQKYVNKIFKKINIDLLLTILDDASRKYSNYNKLCYFSKLLSENYINIKKHCIANDEVLNKYLENEKKLKLAISTILNKLKPESDLDNDNEFEEINLDESLTETINDLEDTILLDISNLQTILVDALIARKSHYSSIDFVINLKKLDSMLVLKNNNLKEEISTVISHEIIHSNEQTCTNIVSKIKYSLANYILSNERYAKVYKNTYFKRLLELDNENDSSYVLIFNNDFAEIAFINNLNNNMEDLLNNTVFLKLKNLRNILNTSNKDAENIENIFTKLKSKFNHLSKINLENIFICKHEDFNFLLILENGISTVIRIESNLELKLINVTEEYNILGNDKNNLPMLYNKVQGIGRLASIMSIFK